MYGWNKPTTISRQSIPTWLPPNLQSCRTCGLNMKWSVNSAKRCLRLITRTINVPSVVSSACITQRRKRISVGQIKTISGVGHTESSKRCKTHLCFFIFFFLFLLVLSIITSHSLSICCCRPTRSGSRSTFIPSRRRVLSHATAPPARLIVSARVSWRAASASASMAASGVSSSVSKYPVGGGEWAFMFASVSGGVEYSGPADGAGRRMEGGCERRRSGRWREKNWWSLNSFEFTIAWEGSAGCCQDAWPDDAVTWFRGCELSWLGFDLAEDDDCEWDEHGSSALAFSISLGPLLLLPPLRTAAAPCVPPSAEVGEAESTLPFFTPEPRATTDFGGFAELKYRPDLEEKNEE